LVFLGRLEDVAGGAQREVPLAATLDAVLSQLEPALADALRAERIRVAVNGALVADRAAVSLADGDEVAFLPPVSGG
jgi:molybdopterin synthase sulfur carrier subunit